MNQAMSDPGPAVARLRQARRVLVTAHERPDGDAVGSELALAELARHFGAEVRIFNRDPAPMSLQDLPGVGEIQVVESLPSGFESTFDLLVTLECSDLTRSGFTGLNALPILNIDHHPGNPGYGEVNFLDPTAPAVGEMVWRMFDDADVRPSADVATNAYVALSTDTGDFRYSSANPRAFRAAAEMVQAGAEPVQVAEWIHGRRSLASVRLLGEALATLRLAYDGRLATVQLDEQAFARAGASPTDSEDIINHPRAIEGVQIVAFFKQWEPGVVRVSMRSRGPVDVRSVATSFGGGGHVNAAACTLESPLEEAWERVTAALGEALGSAS